MWLVAGEAVWPLELSFQKSMIRLKKVQGWSKFLRQTRPGCMVRVLFRESSLGPDTVAHCEE